MFGMGCIGIRRKSQVGREGCGWGEFVSTRIKRVISSGGSGEGLLHVNTHLDRRRLLRLWSIDDESPFIPIRPLPSSIPGAWAEPEAP